MFGGSLFADYENDPFFRGHQQQMAALMQDPFASMRQPAMTRDIARRGERSQAIAVQDPYQNMFAMQPFGIQGGMMGGMPGMDIFGQMNHMMSGMRSMMQGATMQGATMQGAAMGDPQSNPNGQFYSHSSVMSYSSDGQGAPRVYQASRSTTQAPGGLREERKSVRDSAAGVEKAELGRHIGDRGHVISRSRDTRTGDLEENQELLNLDDEEAPAFNHEFQERVAPYVNRHGGHRRNALPSSRHNASHRPRAITDGRARYEGVAPRPAHHQGQGVAPRASHHQGEPPQPAHHHPAVRDYRERD